MCGRYTQAAAFDELALRFGITVENTGLEDLAPRYNVAPSQSVPIVVAHNGGRQLVMARWGFHPVWMKTSTLAPINAKAETVATSRMFQAAVKHHRCLVPADGFYEWKPVPGQRRKQPYYLRLKGGGLFAFAGLYTPTDGPGGAAGGRAGAVHHHHAPAQRPGGLDSQPDAGDPRAGRRGPLDRRARDRPGHGAALPPPASGGAYGGVPGVHAGVIARERRAAPRPAGQLTR